MLWRRAAWQLKCYRSSVSVRGPLNCQVFEVFELASGEILQQHAEVYCIHMSSHMPQPSEQLLHCNHIRLPWLASLFLSSLLFISKELCCCSTKHLRPCFICSEVNSLLRCCSMSTLRIRMESTQDCCFCHSSQSRQAGSDALPHKALQTEGLLKNVCVFHTNTQKYAYLVEFVLAQN